MMTIKESKKLKRQLCTKKLKMEFILNSDS